MKLSELTPTWFNRALYSVLPRSLGDRLRGAESEQAALTYVTREHPLVFNFKRYVLGKNPHLYRLVVHIVDHCNLNCKGCTHFSNISEPAFVDVDDFARDFKRLSEVFSGITELYLMGGEPLLHPRVNEFIRIARTAFPHANLKLLTNGLLLPKMDDEFFQTLADNRIILSIDLYPVNLKLDWIKAKCAAFNIKLELWEARDEFFKLPIDLTGSQNAEHSFKSCGPISNCVLLKAGRLYPCAYTAYSDIFMKRFKVEGLEAGPDDSISIFDNQPYEIFEFLKNPVPWCRFCNVDAVSTYEWTHKGGSIQDWLPDEACAPADGPH